MKFTFDAYSSLLSNLHAQGYKIRSYHNWQDTERCVILRHDVDYSLKCSLKFAHIEADLGVSSTYFVLLTSDFYNVASPNCLRILRELQSMGHEIGLHFDEKAYNTATVEETISNILRERDILSSILQTPIRCVSMHRPSKATLEADLLVPGMINSYSKKFLHEFKYLSDSRRHWREPVLDIIHSEMYNRLHILTHAFWYHEHEEDISVSVGRFIRTASGERYEQMTENITDIDTILGGNNGRWEI